MRLSRLLPINKRVSPLLTRAASQELSFQTPINGLSAAMLGSAVYDKVTAISHKRRCMVFLAANLSKENQVNARGVFALARRFGARASYRVIALA